MKLTCIYYEVFINSGFSGYIFKDIDYLRSFRTENVCIQVDFIKTEPISKYEGPANIFYNSGPLN